MPNNDAKSAIDLLIRKSRVHFYKPIQIAEILRQHRLEKNWNLKDLESYRNVSKKWRDDISTRLVGRKSTSSQKYQDNVFEDNAMPPKLLLKLGEINKAGNGFVEAYIYRSLEKRLASVYQAEQYIAKSTPDTFSIKKLVALFSENPGLRRSVDKMYEIGVYALFSTLVRALQAQITIEIGNEDKQILKDFEKFISMILGIDAEHTKLVLPAALYRVGVTNAADRGLDMWSNFGSAIQVKHLTLSAELVEDIAEGITADRIAIVCLDSEKETIEILLKQMDWGSRIQGIITIDDLDAWYTLCLNKEYRADLASGLLEDLKTEFAAEFPSSLQIKPFLKERGYDKMIFPKEWEINK